MNKNIYNFTENNECDFAFPLAFPKEAECPNKENEITFNFPDQEYYFGNYKYEEESQEKSLFDLCHERFASQEFDYESLDGFNFTYSPSDSSNVAPSSDKTKSEVKRTNSDTQLGLISNDEDKLEQKMDSCTIQECDFECDPEIAHECAHGDLNLFFEKLLNATAVDYLKDQGIEVDDKTAQELTIKKRKRKTKSQIQLLDAEYKKNPDWSRQYMQELGAKLGMSLSSIYKWHWDQKHKNEKPVENKRCKKVRLSSMPNKKSSHKRAKLE